MSTMNWTQSTVNSGIWQATDLAYSSRIDIDLSANPAEQTYILDLQAAAVEYAETAMGCSLLNRTVTATFYGPNSPSAYGYQYSYDYRRNRLPLPHGPILNDITSVTDANGLISSASYQLCGAGIKDYLQMNIGWNSPLTVVYTAGYGTNPSSVPADIKLAIRSHVGSLYENRESIADKAMLPVPHNLEAFYHLKSRQTGVG